MDKETKKAFITTKINKEKAILRMERKELRLKNSILLLENKSLKCIYYSLVTVILIILTSLTTYLVITK